MPRGRPIVGIVGGASGVGKTTLLSALASIRRINTGDLFKEQMSLVDRDAIRSGDWSSVEQLVVQRLAKDVRTILLTEDCVVVDTHFAAKLRGKNYRIGLQRNLLFSFGREIFSSACPPTILVIHIDADPYSLLDRRRLDASRNREIIPSDCVTALSRNSVCAGQYLQEMVRAAHACNIDVHTATGFHRIENSNRNPATQTLRNLLFRGG